MVINGRTDMANELHRRFAMGSSVTELPGSGPRRSIGVFP